MKSNLRLRFLFLQVQELIGEGVFSLKTRAELLEVLKKHGANGVADTQEAPVDRGFFMIGAADDEQKRKA